MSTPDPRIEAIFHEALNCVPAGREAFVAQACVGDESLQREVQRLLAAHEDAGTYFETPKSPELEAELTRLKPEEKGEQIGRYKLLQEIGQGGFGSVWMAEQVEPVSRLVALKLIKMGMDTREVIARFEAERQALAMMDHPNIARVFDAGATQGGRPFFVMELVKGIPITRFCDEQEFGTRQRLELFADVCSAINHAHQKGVIHRDIKPSNVMVTLDGDRPVVKVIDFGIAKATQGKLTDRTLFTRFEQFVGTPVYMSPEQAAISELDIDTRSDIYGLGILLYELLTGKPPFDAKSLVSAGYEEMRRIIREVEPPKPSLLLSTVAGDGPSTLTRARQIPPGKLSRLIAPDLDWIVMKAIEKDRDRRYETANALVLDIRRFLADEPVSATPPSAAYRFRKFARRNRAALRTAVTIALVLISTTIVSIWQAVRAIDAEDRAKQKAADETVARKEADKARLDAEAVSEFLAGIFRSPNPSVDGRGITVAEALNRAIRKLDADLAKQPAQKVKLQSTIAWTLRSLGLNREGIPLAEKGRDYYLATFGPEHPETLGAMHGLALFYLEDGRVKEATKLMEEVVAAERRVLPTAHPEQLQAFANLAVCYTAASRPAEALALREEAMALSLRVHGAESFQSATAKTGLAESYHAANRQEEALQLREEALGFRSKILKPGHSDVLFLKQRLAESYDAAGRKSDAQQLRAEINSQKAETADYPFGDPYSAFAKTKEKGRTALVGGHYDDAVLAYRELWRLRQDYGVIGEKGASPDACLVNAMILSAGKIPTSDLSGRSAALKREAGELFQALLARPTDVPLGILHVDLFATHGNWHEAALLCGPLHEAFPGNPWPAFRLGPLLIELGKTDDFDKHCRELLQPLTSVEQDKLEPLLRSLEISHLGHSLDVIAKTICLRSPTDAELKWAVLLAERATAIEKDPSHYWYVFTRGLAAYRRGNHESAGLLLEEAISHLPTAAQAGAQAVLAMARARQGNTELARLALQNSIRLHDPNWFSPNRIALEGSPVDWLIAHILLREATTLIDAGK